MYSGSARDYTDSDQHLQPFTEYQYMVSVYNSAGDVSSGWVSVRTLQAPPSDVSVPVLLESAVTSFTIGIIIAEPTVLNGVLLHYVVYMNDTQVSTQMVRLGPIFVTVDVIR